MNRTTGCSFYNSRMRFWLLVFLSILMPLQLSMAAVGQFCQHETVAASKHLGHHVHRHSDATQADSDSGIGNALMAELDCGSCHAGCSIAIPVAQASIHIEASRTFSTVARHRPGTAPVDVPDRPQWRSGD